MYTFIGFLKTIWDFDKINHPLQNGEVLLENFLKG